MKEIEIGSIHPHPKNPKERVMSDLISREDAIKAVCKECLREFDEDKCEYENECGFKDAIIALPSADAVTHGRPIDADALSEKLCETTIQRK